MTSKIETLFNENYNSETETWSSKEKQAEAGALKYMLEGVYLPMLKDSELTIPESLKSKAAEIKTN